MLCLYIINNIINEIYLHLYHIHVDILYQKIGNVKEIFYMLQEYFYSFSALLQRTLQK